MSISKKFYSLVVAGLLAFANVAQAAVPTVYEFGTYVTGSTYGSGFTTPFATLNTSDNGAGTWTFTLTLNDSFSTFGASAFTKLLSFDFTPDLNKIELNNLTTGLVGTGGVEAVAISKPTGGSSTGFNFDFGSALGQGDKDRLVMGEKVTWTVAGISMNAVLSNMLFHVQGIPEGDGSAKYSAISPVPEAQTYAMMMVGLGLIGFSVRRKKHEA